MYCNQLMVRGQQYSNTSASQAKLVFGFDDLCYPVGREKLKLQPGNVLQPLIARALCDMPTEMLWRRPCGRDDACREASSSAVEVSAAAVDEQNPA